MPRIKTEFNQPVIIEIIKDGISIGEVVCFVEEISFNLINKSSTVEVNVYNPNYKGRREITTSEVII